MQFGNGAKLVSDVKGGIQSEGVWEQFAAVIIWTEQGRSDRRFEKTAYLGT
jgi:hypothetical protein